MTKQQDIRKLAFKFKVLQGVQYWIVGLMAIEFMRMLYPERLKYITMIGIIVLLVIVQSWKLEADKRIKELKKEGEELENGKKSTK